MRFDGVVALLQVDQVQEPSIVHGMGFPYQHFYAVACLHLEYHVHDAVGTRSLPRREESLGLEALVCDTTVVIPDPFCAPTCAQHVGLGAKSEWSLGNSLSTVGVFYVVGVHLTLVMFVLCRENRDQKPQLLRSLTLSDWTYL